MPTGKSYTELKLERGLFEQSFLGIWVRRCIEELDFSPAEITIMLLNSQQLPVATWQVHEAIPVSWSVSGFDANSSAIVVESLDLKYESFEFIPGVIS